MAGYQGTLSEDFPGGRKHAHDALSGNETTPGGLPPEDPHRDQALRQEIRNSLDAHVEVHAENIEVFVKDGFVSLTGTVQSAEDKAMVEGLVESVDGVKDVASLIALDSESDIARSISGDDDYSIQSPS